MKKVKILLFITILLLLTASPIFAIKPTISIKADPASILNGETSKLIWTSTGATSASINQGIGSVPVNGSIIVTPTITTTYTITVRNSSGYRTASVKVTVKPALPVITFTASPTSILSGQSSTLSWTTSNASSVSINQGIGTVALNGSRAVSPSVTTTYTLTATGSGGTVTATATVTVTTGPPVITFSASPTTIQEGQGSTLSWTTTSATSVTIEPGIGITGLNSTATVFPTQTTIYTLTATGPGGTSSSQVEVQVQAATPTVTLSATPMAIQAGESATLSWSSSKATSAILDNGIGIVDLNGSMQVSPTATTTYTITVTGPGGSKSASATVTVFSGIRYYAYIPDYSDKKIRIVDTNTGVVQKSIDIIGTTTNLQGVSADLSGVYTYIAESGSTRIIKIDPLTMTKVDELAMTANFQGKPKHIALASDGCYLYATSSVPLWNPASGKYVGTICAIKTSGDRMASIRGVGVDLPHQISLEGLAISPDHSRIFVADPDNNRILVLDADKMHRYTADMVEISDELITTIPIATPPLGISFSPNGQFLYVFADSTIYEIDAVNLAVNRSVTVPNGNRFMKVHPDGSRIYVVTREYLSIVETAGFTKTATKSIAGLYYCTGFDVHPDGSRMFFADKTSDKLITVDTSTYQVIFNTTLGTDPAAFGSFLGHLPITIGGNVTQDRSGLSGATLTLDGEGILRTKQTATAGDFLFGLKPGDYQLTPTMSNLAFTPENMNLHVTESQTGLVFSVSGVVPPPTVTLTSSSTWVDPYETFTLSWDSTGADYVTLEVVTSDHLPPSGTRNFSLQSTTTIFAVAYNRGGTASASVKIYVSDYDPPTATINANPSSIQRGSSSTLTWSTSHAATVTIDNGIGTVAASGSKVVSPITTTTYTITAIHSNGYKVTMSATVTVSEFDTSAKLTGTVTDFANNQPLNEVQVSASDASGVPQTALTDVDGKYTISNLRVGDVNVSFTKTGYDSYQQIINIPSNTTFDLTTQLHQTQIRATLRGLVKDGQTNLPIVGATVIAAYPGSSQTSTSAVDGSYILTNIPLGINATITASYTGYQSKTIQQTFSQAKVYVWDFAIYGTSVVAIINGKITNAKTQLPEAGVKVTHEGSNASTTTTDDGYFVFDNIPFGEQTFYFKKTGFIEETITSDIDHTPFTIDLIKPSSEGGQIKIGQNICGIIQDSISQLPIAGAKIRVPGLNLEAVSDANGNYSLTGLPIGTYPVIVLAFNHQSMNFMASVVPDETNKADFVLIPLANGLIKGTITDAATGEPVAGACIEIEGSAMLTAASEGDGTYKMVGVPPGTYKVLILCAEYADASVENVEVQDQTPTTIDLQLNKRPVTGALVGRILDNTNGFPVSGATVTVSETGITATTDVYGNYRLDNVPAGLNDIIVSASGYPESPRIRAVIADKDPFSPSTTSSDIKIDVGSSIVDESVTAIITANEGGDIITKDSRFLLHIFPGTLSADARITLKDASDGPSIPIGSDLPLDPALGIEGIKAASIMTQIEIAPVNSSDPAPTINGLAAFAARYEQKDTDAFQLDENTAFMYSWNGNYFTAMNPRPYELAVDKINNIVYSVIDLSKTIGGTEAQFSKKTLLTTDPVKKRAVMSIATTIMIKIIGKSIKNIIIPPRTNVKIFDKNELDAVATAPFDKIPNPNALPLLVIHGFDPMTIFGIAKKVTNPNNVERYRLMLEDIVDSTNGVYRPIFVSYNTEAKITSIAQSLAENIFGEYRDQDISFKGLPSDPNDPASGTFPYLDTFGFSMGGLVSRDLIAYNKINRIHNMTMIGTPNHGTFFCLKYLFENNSLFGSALGILKLLNFGASDMLDYDDDKPIEGFKQNPFLFLLNSPTFSSAVTPRGDMTLFAGNDESAWGGLTNVFLASPHDSLVTVKSVYCRPTNSTLESKLSLLKTNEPKAKKFEIPPKNFSHDNIGKQEYRIAEFSAELAKGFSDWTVERVFNENPMDNAFIKPTKDVGGYCKSKVKVEYNVWVPDAERQARDFDRVVLVIYHKDGNEHWHISEPKGGENGADVNGNVVGEKVKSISGNSKFTQASNPLILDATVNFDPNPTKGEIGYEPEKDIVDTIFLVIPLIPGKITVPLDPTKAHFRTPNMNE